MTDRYVLFGNPVAHSPSPGVHAAFAAQTGQDLRYDRQLVPLGEFARAAADFFAGGGRGGNVTVPFKEDAFRCVGRLSARARRAGAVNTLVLENGGQVLGDNTDGVGLVRDLTANLGWVIADRRVLILGAGGAARGVLAPLLAEQPAQLLIANRTADKAEHLAQVTKDVAGEYSCFAGNYLVETGSNHRTPNIFCCYLAKGRKNVLLEAAPCLRAFVLPA